MAGHCPWVLVWPVACYWHGAGGFVFNSPPSSSQHNGQSVQRDMLNNKMRCMAWRVRIVHLLHQLRKGVGAGAGVDTSVKTLRAAWKSSPITREVGSSSSPIIPSESESYLPSESESYLPSESESYIPSESESHVTSMDISMVRRSMNAPLGLEYLVGHNRSRTLSQTSSNKQPSDSFDARARPEPASSPGHRRQQYVVVTRRCTRGQMTERERSEMRTGDAAAAAW